jgi:hypothetical protein
MAMIPLKEYAQRHGKHPANAAQKAARGTFRTARKIGRFWIIDENEPYDDARIKSGIYSGWRKKAKRKAQEKTQV